MGCIRWTRDEIGRPATSARLLAAVALVGILVIVAALVPSRAAAQSPGGVNFELHARTPEEGLVASSGPAEQAWMREHYESMRGYAPFFNQALGWAPPSNFYLDLYALYSGQERDEALMQQHPDWVLRDSSGNRLYIPFECSGTCGQYAADVGNPEWRAHWIATAKQSFSLGYAGIFVDDVNLEMAVSNGDGDWVAPIDPRTGQPMTEENWRRYVAEFTEEIRAAFPDKEIIHNSIWWMDHDDPYVQREVAAADVIEMERGFNDEGLANGGGQWGYETYLAHVDWLHSQGAGVVYEPYGLDPQSAVFELASYLLASNGNDSITSQFHSKPEDWWSGWDTDLGTPKSGRREWKGLLRRDFAGGVVLVNQPDAAATTVKLPGRVWTDTSGARVKRIVTLGERSALVLHRGPKAGRRHKR